MKRLRTWIRVVLDHVFVSPCLLCLGKTLPGFGLCETCRYDLPCLDHSCEICAMSLLPEMFRQHSVCGKCLTQPPEFARAIAAFAYRSPIDYLIRGVKYHGRYVDVRTIAQLMAWRLKQLGVTLPDILIPVPLHRKRLSQRGFNQAYEIAKLLAHHFGIRMDASCVRKICDRQPQTALTAKYRLHNARGAYQLHHKPFARHVAIVDDVMTTGATVNEIARLLNTAGIDIVEVWVVARTLKGA